MDVLSLYVGYTIVFAFGLSVYMYSDAPLLNTGVLGSCKRGIFKVFNILLPSRVITGFHKIVYYLFYTRNHALQVVFCALVILGHVTLIIDMLPLLTMFDPDGSHTFWPITFLFTNLAFYQLSCLSNPGNVAKGNVDAMCRVYKMDELMYKSDSECRTCKVSKPARSKHCSFCGRCVHRFDHHCVWTNNCVGALNLRYFIFFLITLIIMCINGIVLGIHCLGLVVQHFRLMETSYIDDATGELHPVTYRVLFQHLFMQYPRIVVLVASLILLQLLLMPFAMYHIYLICINQTTNERYKLSSLKFNRHNNNTVDSQNIPQSWGKFYSKGLLLNLCEVFFPQIPSTKKNAVQKASPQCKIGKSKPIGKRK